MVIKTYRFRFYPTAAQQRQLETDFNCARWVWNTALDARGLAYRALGRSENYVSLSRAINELKQDPDYIWLNDANSTVLTQTLRDQDRAFENFFAGRTQYPRFKKKYAAQAVRYQLDQQHIEWIFYPQLRILKLPKMGTLRLRWSQSVKGAPKMVTVKQDAGGRYFVTFSCEIEIPLLPVAAGDVGVDFGIKDIAALSDGFKSGNPRCLKRRLRYLKRAQRRLSRKQRGSNRYRKQQIRVARLHAKVAATRRNFLHQVSWKIINDNQVITLQPHNLNGMLKNRCLARAISDAGLGEFTRQLRYKAQWYGRTLIEISPWQRTTGVCPECLIIGPKLALAIRQWTCTPCGAVHDRDTASAEVIKLVGRGIAPEFRRAEGEPPVWRQPVIAGSQRHPLKREFVGLTN